MSKDCTGHRYRAQQRRTAVAGILFAVVIAFISACGGSGTGIGPEEEIRGWLQRGVVAAEAKERRELVAMISPAYRDARGNDRDRIENMLRAYFFRMNSIELLPAVEEINVIGDSAAELLLTVGMAGGHDGVFGFSADAYRFSLELEKAGADWELISARWGQLGEELR